MAKSELVKAKWLLPEGHIHNHHKSHGKVFPRCTDEKLVGQEHNKKLFKRRRFYEKATARIPFMLHLFADTKASEKLSALLTDNRLPNDLVRLLPPYQISTMESISQCNDSLCTIINSIFVCWNEVQVNCFTLFYKSLSKRMFVCIISL